MKIPRLREWREAMGETQLTLAERSGVAEHTISRIEQGYGARPNTAKKLADALDVSVMDLMESPPVLAGKAEAPEAGPPAFEAGDVVASIPYDESTPSGAIGDAVAAAFKEARGRVPDGVGLVVDINDARGTVEVSVKQRVEWRPVESAKRRGKGAPKEPRRVI